MKKGLVILLLGLFAAAAAFSGRYYLGTAHCRALMNAPQPELAWLKREFNLSDAEFARVTKLHEAYLPQCRQRCLLLADQDRKLQQLLATATTMTPEIHNLLLERARTRADCEAEMLNHFLAVSRTMPPEQGRRYLAWVESQSSFRGQAMEERHKTENPTPKANQPEL